MLWPSSNEIGLGLVAFISQRDRNSMATPLRRITAIKSNSLIIGLTLRRRRAFRFTLQLLLIRWWLLSLRHQDKINDEDFRCTNVLSFILWTACPLVCVSNPRPQLNNRRLNRVFPCHHGWIVKASSPALHRPWRNNRQAWRGFFVPVNNKVNKETETDRSRPEHLRRCRRPI